LWYGICLLRIRRAKIVKTQSPHMVKSSLHYLKHSHMKLFTHLTGILLIGFISSCSSYQPGSSREADDRYYSLSDARKDQRAARKLNASQPSSFAENGSNNNVDPSSNEDSNYQRIPDGSNYTPNNGGAVTNNYYGDNYDLDSYYDHMYESRIRRFHRNTGNFGFYDPFFTNSYFYNNNPMMFGNSIYSSYGFFNPYVPWGFNNWGGGPGLNLGWSSFGGFYMNFNSGWNNPYFMYNNPWRWNTWGYNPWSSPFGYNPWAYNPYGFGFNNWNNPGMFGCSNAFMYGTMMNNPVYYNSFDNNSFNNTSIVNNYGPNLGGAGGGSSFKQDQSLSNVFSKEIGQSLSTVHSSEVKGSSPINSGTQGKGNSVISATEVKPDKQSGGAVKGQPSVSGTQVVPGKQSGTNVISGTDVNPAANNPKGQIQPSTSVNPAAGKGSTVQPDVKGSQVVPATTADVKGQSQNPSQDGKQNLIQQGVAQPSKNTQPVLSNYNSAPVKGTQAAPENSPAMNRPPNIDPSKYDSPKNQNNVANPSGIRSGADAKPQPYTPNYDYSNGVKGSGNNDIRGTYQTPNRNVPRQNQVPNVTPPKQKDPTPAQNYQQYQAPNRTAPKQQNQAPAQNYQQYRAPNTTAPKQQNQTPAPGYQQYQSPRQSTPSQQYQAPNRQYDTPRQKEQPRQNSSPNQQYNAPRQQYNSPSQNSPREQYRAPSQQNQAPSRQNYQAPRQSSPRQSFSSPSPSPKMSSPSPSPSRSSGGGGKSSSPRR